MASSAARVPEAWPRLMSADVAAAYCGVSVPFFEAHVKVDPLRVGGRLDRGKWTGGRVLYDRAKLDAWIEQMQSPQTGEKDWLSGFR